MVSGQWPRVSRPAGQAVRCGAMRCRGPGCRVPDADATRAGMRARRGVARCCPPGQAGGPRRAWWGRARESGRGGRAGRLGVAAGATGPRGRWAAVGSCCLLRDPRTWPGRAPAGPGGRLDRGAGGEWTRASAGLGEQGQAPTGWGKAGLGRAAWSRRRPWRGGWHPEPPLGHPRGCVGMVETAWVWPGSPSPSIP